MTRSECESKIAVLLLEIRNIALEYSPESTYMTATISKKEGEDFWMDFYNGGSFHDDAPDSKTPIDFSGYEVPA